MRQVLLLPKSGKDTERKELQSNISHENTCKNSKENSRKLILTICNNNSS